MGLYNISGPTIRADITAKVEEAAMADKLFIGLEVMPPLPVSAKSGTYPKVQIAAGDLLTPLATARTPGSSYGRTIRGWTTDTYDCMDLGLESPVDDTVAADVGRFFNVEAAEANWTRRNVQLAHEVRVAAAIMNTNFTGATNSAVAYTTGNLATINFPLDVIAAIERVAAKGNLANSIVMSSTVLHRIATATLLQSWIRGTATGNAQVPVNADNIAASFRDYGIERCLIGRSVYNSAKKGQAASLTNVWGTTYVWIGNINPGARVAQDGGAGFTLYWDAEGGPFVAETYRDEASRSNMVRVRQNCSEKVVDATGGTLITTQYS